MTNKDISAQIEQLLDGLDSQEAVTKATQLLHKRFFEKALNAELDSHLGYEKHHQSHNSNSRNGSTRNTVYTDDGVLDLQVPRDRAASFEPEIIKKRQTRVPTLDSKIVFLYSQGMMVRPEFTRHIS